jgi:hypothetical protein
MGNPVKGAWGSLQDLRTFFTSEYRRIEGFPSNCRFSALCKCKDF